MGSGIEKIISNNLDKPSFYQILGSPDIYYPIIAFIIIFLLSFFVKKFIYKNNGAQKQDRTADLLLTMQMLFQLSYLGKKNTRLVYKLAIYKLLP